MKATLNELKNFELNKDMQRKLIGGIDTSDYQTKDTAVDGVTVFRRELLD
jgi:hypothetical protein